MLTQEQNREKAERMSPRWQHRSFLTPPPAGEELTTIYEQGTSEGVPELESEAEAEGPPALQRPRRLHQKGKKSGCMLTTLPLPTADTALH